MLTFVLGGARSGKSRYAQSLMGSGPVSFIATASATLVEDGEHVEPGDGTDDEMTRRIEQHRAARPSGWITLEEPLHLGDAVRRIESPDRSVLIDCVTIWLSNTMWTHRELDPAALETRVAAALEELCLAIGSRDAVIVSNDVGSGTVPSHAVARHFRDLQGLANQLIARHADRVVLLIAGVPMTIKG